MRRLVSAWLGFGVLLVAARAFAHPPDVDDEGTPDPRPRDATLETTPTTRASPPALLNASNAELPDASAVERVAMPEHLPYYPWAPVPLGYRLGMGGARKAMVVTGVIVFATSHVLSVVSSILVATQCNSTCGAHAGESAIPIVGPFIAFAAQGENEPTGLYLALGASQIAGFGMLLAGATMTDMRLDRERVKFSVAPLAVPGAYGGALRASF